MPGEGAVPSRTRNPIKGRMREMRGLAGARAPPGGSWQGSGREAQRGSGRWGRPGAAAPTRHRQTRGGCQAGPRGPARGSPRTRQWPWAWGAAWQRREPPAELGACEAPAARPRSLTSVGIAQAD